MAPLWGIIFLIVLTTAKEFIQENTPRRVGKNLTDLHIAGIFPMKGTAGWIGGPGCYPAAMMALEDINGMGSLLPNYRLDLKWNDSECQPGLGASVMYELLYHPPQKLMLLCGCSIVCTTVAEAAKMWNLIVLSFGSSSPALSNRERFPTFFRTHPSATVHNPTRIKIFQTFKWQRIAILQQAEEVFISTVEDLELKCKEEGIEILTRQSFLTDPTDAVRNLQRHDARIIVGLFYVGAARRVMCEVYKTKLYGRQYMWFLIGWYEDNWYEIKDDHVTCTTEQMREVVDGHITTEALMLNQDNRTTISGMTSEQFIIRLDKELEKQGYPPNKKPEGYQEAPLAYDAIWAIAIALNKTMHRLKDTKYALEDFDYNNKEIADIIYSAMNSTQFTGVSGTVAFSAKGDRIALTLIEQLIEGKYVKLGTYDNSADKLVWLRKAHWIGGRPPSDRTISQPILRTVSLSLFISVAIISCMGIMIAIALLAFNIAYRHRRFIQFSHPACNNIMLIGNVMCFISVILLGLDGQFIPPEDYPAVCEARAWILCMGFTLAYGSMFQKIWRAHRLATSKAKNQKVHTWRLYTMLGTLLTIDVSILVSWGVIDPLQRKLEIFPNEKPLNTDEDIEWVPQLEHCQSVHNNVWLGIMCGYKGLLLIFGIFLAYETRSLKFKLINDSRYVGMSIYNVVVLCMITAPVAMVISSQQDASFAFVALAIIFCCFLSMALIFIPKVIDLVRHPRERADSRHLTDSCPSKEDEEKHRKLLAENEELKQLIAEQEDKIRLLNQKLKERGALVNEDSLHKQDHCNADKEAGLVRDTILNKDNNKKDKSGVRQVGLIGGREQQPPPHEKNVIVVDLNSDSAIGLSTSIARSPRTSPSDFELSESYL